MTDEQEKQLQKYIEILSAARKQLEFDLIVAADTITALKAQITALQAVETD